MKTINFFLTDIDYQITSINEEKQAMIRLFGKLTTSTKSKKVLITLSDFWPYFYVESTNRNEDESILSQIKKEQVLNDWFRSYEVLARMKYYRRQKTRVLKLTGKRPWEVPQVRRALIKLGLSVFEADIPFVKRFLIDNDLRCLRQITVTNLQNIQETEALITAHCSHKDIQQSPDSTKLQPLVMAFDIEVDVTEETIQQILTDKKKRITAISLVWGSSASKYQAEVNILKNDSEEAENNLLYWFIERLQNIRPDVLTGFNCNSFDFPYLLGRMSTLNIPSFKLSPWNQFIHDSVRESSITKTYRIKGISVVDLFPKAWRFHPESGKKGLDDIAGLVLGKEYHKLSVDRTRLGLLWREGLDNQNWPLFSDYVKQDGVLTYKLFFSLGVRDWLEAVAIVGAPPPEGINATQRQLGEFELLRKIYHGELLIPSLPNDAELGRRRELRRTHPHQGGLVFDPQGSLYEGPVIITDFRSMYPSLIVSHNLGAETLKTDDKILNDPEKAESLFEEEPQSVLAEMLDFFLVQRIDLKRQISQLRESQSRRNTQLSEEKKQLLAELNRTQTAIKEIINSVNGGLNYANGRFYSHILSDAMTTIARRYLFSLRNNITSFSQDTEAFQGAEVIYGDTDSLFIHLKAEELQMDLEQAYRHAKRESFVVVLSQAENLIAKINESIRKPMELILEDIAYRIVFKPGRKKAYAYVSGLTNELVIKGFEAVRSDWSESAQEAQKAVLNCLLRERGTPIERGIKAKRITLGICRSILETPVEELKPKLQILGALRNPNRYKSRTPAVAAFLHYAKEEELNIETDWKTFDKFPYVIVPSEESDAPLYKRARHPDLASEIDRWHYVGEIIRAVERFGVILTLEEVKQKRILLPLEQFIQGLQRN
ncbi:MAG: DNA polymerase domain-containing protein [Promethearchaeota archaeon]